MKDVIYQKIAKYKVVPVLVIDDERHAAKTAEALWKGGLKCAEITFRTSAAKESIKRIKETFPDMLVGAGTVTSKEKVDQALEVGAEFIVTPGFVKETVEYGLEKGAVMIPGCVTPGEIEQALNLDLQLLKFFPVSAYGGVTTLNLLSSVYQNVRFMPTGVVNLDNMLEYLNSSAVSATGGIWMATADMIANEKYEEIYRLSKLTAEKLEFL